MARKRPRQPPRRRQLSGSCDNCIYMPAGPTGQLLGLVLSLACCRSSMTLCADRCTLLPGCACLLPPASTRLLAHLVQQTPMPDEHFCMPVCTFLCISVNLHFFSSVADCLPHCGCCQRMPGHPASLMFLRLSCQSCVPLSRPVCPFPLAPLCVLALTSHGYLHCLWLSTPLSAHLPRLL